MAELDQAQPGRTTLRRVPKNKKRPMLAAIRKEPSDADRSFKSHGIPETERLAREQQLRTQ